MNSSKSKEHRHKLAVERGYKSRHEYEKHLNEKRRLKPENRLFGEFLEERLAFLGKSTEWLAYNINVSPRMVESYCNGKNMPSPEKLSTLFNLLELDYRNLQDLINDKKERYEELNREYQKNLEWKL